LTGGAGRVLEGAAGRYRFLGWPDFACSPGVSCPELVSQRLAGERIHFRFAHPAMPSDALSVLFWDECAHWMPCSCATRSAQRGSDFTNGNRVIDLFQGMFDQNILTFNPGWDGNAQKLDSYTEADETTSGPASFVAVDPDGNPILVDQHV
jgi:hypothetical protein